MKSKAKAATIDVEVVQNTTTVVVKLAEITAGTGVWRVVGVNLRAADGSALTVTGLRDFPWGKVLAKAQTDARGDVRTPYPFVRPSDPPPIFRRDRRGGRGPGASDRDYAALARSYLALPPERRREVATAWSSQFGRSAQSWRKDIANAKRFVEEYEVGREESDNGEVTVRTDLQLTDEGMHLLYGPDIFEQLAMEADIDGPRRALKLLDGGGTEIERVLLRLSIDRAARKARVSRAVVEADVRQQAQAKVDAFYPPTSPRTRPADRIVRA